MLRLIAVSAGRLGSTGDWGGGEILGLFTACGAMVSISSCVVGLLSVRLLRVDGSLDPMWVNFLVCCGADEGLVSISSSLDGSLVARLSGPGGFVPVRCAFALLFVSWR